MDALNEVIKSLPRLPQQDTLKPLFIAEAAANHQQLGGSGHVGSLLRIGPEMITMLMGYRPLQKARYRTKVLGYYTTEVVATC